MFTAYSRPNRVQEPDDTLPNFFEKCILYLENTTFKNTFNKTLLTVPFCWNSGRYFCFHKGFRVFQNFAWYDIGKIYC